MVDPLVETEVADSKPPRRSGPWKLIIIVAVITLIGVWLVPDESPREDASVAVPPAQRSASDPTSDQSPSLLGDTSSTGQAQDGTRTDIGEIAIKAGDDRPGAQARAMIARMRAQGEIDFDGLVAAAKNSQIAGELADAYLLYFFAAREGSVAAALELGKQADPATRDPLSSVFENPDFNQAHKWYKMAASEGDTEARDRLEDLHRRVEQLAASGDVQAQRISLLWK